MANSYMSSLPRKIELRSRISPDVFHRPETIPDTSVNNLSQTASSNEFTSSSRKRSRNDGVESQSEIPHVSGFSPWTNCHNAAIARRSSHFTTPPPLINSRYRLAGGLDTPTQTIADLGGTADDGSEHDFRKQWYNERNEQPTRNLDILNGEHNGRVPLWPLATDVQPTWSQFVLDVVGTVAVKVWDFCRTNAFRGFRAGGGDVYVFPNFPGAQDETHNHCSDDGEPSEHMHHNIDGKSASMLESFSSSMNPDEDETRPAKRLQSSQGSSWVMVNHNVQKSPSKGVSSFSSLPRSPPHRSLLPRPSTSRSNATRLPRPSAGHYNTATQSPPTFNKSSASFAQPRSPASTSPSLQRTPGSAEKRRLPIKKGREEWGGDESMRKLNEQLKAMIREGKAALATRVEVHDETGLGSDVDDEGYAEGSDGAGKGWGT